jgi:hypothetical protein
VTSFAATDFILDTTGFANAFTGTFGVSLGGGSLPGDASQIYLTYTAVPEPGSVLLAGLGLASAIRRRRPKS